jgi:hypothetical protein
VHLGYGPSILLSVPQSLRSVHFAVSTAVATVRTFCCQYRSYYGPYILLSVPQLPLLCAAVSLQSAVKQRSQCNTGTVCQCLVMFLLTAVLSTEQRVL